MQSKIMGVLSILAVADSLGIVLAFLGAGECGGSDGCLFFSMVIVIALGLALLILLLSLLAWAVARKRSFVPRHFVVANVILFVSAAATAGAMAWAIR